MSMRLIQNITGMQGIGNGQVGTLVMLPNVRYHDVRFFLTEAGAPAAVDTIVGRVVLKVGGVVIRDTTADQLVRYAKLFGMAPATGELPIFFSEPWFEDPRIAESFSWDMFGQARFTVELTFLNPAGAVGVSAVLASVDTIRNVISDGKGGKRPFLRIMKMKNENFVFQGAGLVGNTGLDRTLPIRRLLVDLSGGATCSQLQVLADGVSKYDLMTPTQLSDIYESQKLDNSQFKVPLVFDFDNLGRSRLVAQQLELKLNPSGATTATILNVQEADRFV